MGKELALVREIGDGLPCRRDVYVVEPNISPLFDFGKIELRVEKSDRFGMVAVDMKDIDASVLKRRDGVHFIGADDFAIISQVVCGDQIDESPKNDFHVFFGPPLIDLFIGRMAHRAVGEIPRVDPNDFPPF